MTTKNIASIRNYRNLLEERWSEGKFVCIGLDPVWNELPDCVKRPSHQAVWSVETQAFVRFCCEIVEETSDLVCAYKPNAAFFEAFGACGREALEAILKHIRRAAPKIPVIYDSKRGDIGNTNLGYIKDAFQNLQADAITVSPFLGQEALRPFLEQKEKGIFVLCKTSNPGASEFQDLEVIQEKGSVPLYQYVAHQVTNRWNSNQNCALVVGATCPEELERVRRIAKDLPILIPGIGAQGGDLVKTIASGKNSGGTGMIINSSRSIIYASKEDDFAYHARAEAEKLHQAIKGLL